MTEFAVEVDPVVVEIVTVSGAGSAVAVESCVKLRLMGLTLNGELPVTWPKMASGHTMKNARTIRTCCLSEKV